MRIRYRFLVVLLIVFAAFGIGVVALHRYQVGNASEAIVTLARKAADDGNITQAVGFYRQYVGLKPDDAAARAELGELLVKMGEFQAAFFELEGALRLDSTMTSTRQKLVEVAMVMGRYTDAKTHLTEQLIPSDPDNAEFQWRLARCERGLGNNAEALSDFRKAVELEPKNPTYASDLANLLSSDQISDLTAARAVLDQLVTAADEDPLVFVVRGSWLLDQSSKLAIGDNAPRQSLLDAAWTDAQSALKLAPTSAPTVAFAVNVALQTKRESEVRDYVFKAIDANPNAVGLYQSAAQLELSAEKPELAKQVLRDGLKANPGQADLLWSLANLELKSGNIEIVEQLLTELRALDYGKAPISLLEALILSSQGEWRQAAKLIEDSRAHFDRNESLLARADFELAKCYNQLGNFDQQVEAMRRAVRNDPRWQEGRVSLAAALLQSGRFNEALAEYRQAVRQPNAPVSAVTGLASLLFIDTLRKGGSEPDWKPLESLLTVLEQYSEADEDVIILRSEMLFAQGAKEESQQKLQEYVDENPSRLRPRQALVALHVRNQDWDEADAVLASTEKSLDDAPEIRLDRARFLIQRDAQKVDMDRMDQLATPSPEWTDAQQTELASGFARYFLSLGDFERCERHARLAAESERGRSDLAIHLLIFDMALRSRDAESMDRWLKRVKEIEGEGPLWRVGEAVRLTVEADNLSDEEVSNKASMYAKAIDHLKEAAVLRPGWSRVSQLQGWINLRQNRNDLAVDNYLQAIELGEQDPQVISQTMSLLFQQQRFAEADKLVAKLQAQRVPFSSEMLRAASQVAMELDNIDRAINLAKGWAEQSQRQEDRVWLAQVYSIAKRHDEAEAEFREAIKLDPSAPAPWISLIQMLARLGRVDQAKQVIEEASASMDADKSAIALAQAYQAINDFEGAEASYQLALDSAPDDPSILIGLARLKLAINQRDAAQPLLERIIGLDGETAEVERSWARRNLALILGLQGDPELFERAQQLLRENADGPAPAGEDQRVLGIILGSQKDMKYVAQAISIMEEVVEDQQNYSLQDNYLLAQLYARTDDWTRYSRTMRGVLGHGGSDNATYVRTYAESLLSRGELDESRLWLDRLKSLASDQLETDTIQARLFFASQDYRRLLDLLKSNAIDPQRVSWSAEAADFYGTQLEKDGKTELAQGFLDLAFECYEKVAETDPERPLALASFHARHGDIDASLSLVTDQNADQLAKLSEVALLSGTLTREKAVQLVSRLESLPKNGDSRRNLEMVIGDLYSWLGDWQNSMKAYQSVIATDPKDVAALNNLAVVLALTRNRLDIAQKAIERALATAGPLDALLDTRGSIRMALGDAKAAESDFRMALQSATRPGRLLHLADALLKQGATEEAQKAFAQAIELGATLETIHPLERPAFERMSERFRTQDG